MAVLQRVNIVGNERYDLVDFKNLQDFLADDLKVLNTCFYTPTSYIIKGFKTLDSGGLDIDVTVASSALFNTSVATGGEFFAGDSTASNLSETLTDNTVNFIHVQLSKTTIAPDSRVFWDKTANNGEGAEFVQVIDTAEILVATLHITTSGFSASAEHIPLARVETSGGDIVAIHDHRNMLFRLGRGEPKNPDFDFPWASGRIEPPYTISLNSVTGTFLANETVTGGTSGATSVLQTGGTTSIKGYKLSADFTIGETLTGSSSGATGTLVSYFEDFDGADKSLKGQKDLFDALASEIRLLKGTDYWFEKGDFSFKTFFEDLALTVISGGGTLSWLDSKFTTKSFTNQSTIIFNHSLGAKPIVQVIDINDQVIIPDSVVHNSVDQVTITLSNSLTGTVFLTGGVGSTFASTSFTSQSSVVFNHGLGAEPLIQVIDNNNQIITPDSVTHNTVNQTTVVFGTTITGEILATGGVTSEFASTSFSSQSTIVFNHNLGAKPLIQINDSSDQIITPDSITHNNNNQATIVLSTALSGDIVAAGGVGQQLSWTSDLTLNVIGTSTTYTIPTSQAPLSIADGQVAYIDIDEGGNRGVSGNRTLVISNRELVPTSGAPIDGDVYWIAYRDSNKLFFRGVKQELEPGEEVEIGDTISEDYLTYTGMTSETDSDPNYTSTVFVTQGTSLTEAISDLDSSAIGSSTGTSTDNAIARWDGTTGTKLQDSGIFIDDNDNLLISSGDKLILNGVATNSVYLINDTGNEIGFFLNDIERFRIAESSIIIPSGDKFYLDGGSDTYIYESATNTMDFFAGTNHNFRISSGVVSVEGVNLDMNGGNIILDSGKTVDGVDVSAHASDSSIHFTEASIDHGSITGLGGDDHSQYLHLDKPGGGTQIAQHHIGVLSGTRFYLDGGTDTYMVFDSGSNAIDFFIDSNEVFTFKHSTDKSFIITDSPETVALIADSSSTNSRVGTTSVGDDFSIMRDNSNKITLTATRIEMLDDVDFNLNTLRGSSQVVKAWARVPKITSGTASPSGNYNVDDITKNISPSDGNYTINFTNNITDPSTGLGTSSYACVVTPIESDTSLDSSIMVTSQTASSVTIQCFDSSQGNAAFRDMSFNIIVIS